MKALRQAQGDLSCHGEPVEPLIQHIQTTQSFS